MCYQSYIYRLFSTRNIQLYPFLLIEWFLFSMHTAEILLIQCKTPINQSSNKTKTSRKTSIYQSIKKKSINQSIKNITDSLWQSGILDTFHFPPGKHFSGTELSWLYSSCLNEYPDWQDKAISVFRAVYFSDIEFMVHCERVNIGQSSKK